MPIDLDTIISSISILVAAVGVMFALNGVKQRVWLSVFTEYTKRYSDILAEFPEEVIDNNFKDRLSGLEKNHD
jgi:hypothetical protein